MADTKELQFSRLELTSHPNNPNPSNFSSITHSSNLLPTPTQIVLPSHQTDKRLCIWNPLTSLRTLQRMNLTKKKRLKTIIDTNFSNKWMKRNTAKTKIRLGVLMKIWNRNNGYWTNLINLNNSTMPKKMLKTLIRRNHKSHLLLVQTRRQTVVLKEDQGQDTTTETLLLAVTKNKSILSSVKMAVVFLYQLLNL